MNLSRPGFSFARLVTGLFLLFTFAATPAARGQSRGDGSVYSRFGIGSLENFSSSQIEALGNGGTALHSLNYINLRNPASWADQLLTRAVAGVHFRRVRATDGLNKTNPSDLTTGGFTAAQLSFPILKRKIGVGFSLQPYTRSDYRVLVDNQHVTSARGDTARYQTSFEGRGGLQQVVGGAGYRINDQLDVGATVHVIFGTYEDARRITFQTAGYQGTNVTTSTRMLGVTGTVGALYRLGSLFRDDDHLELGAALTLPTSLSAERSITIGESLDRDTLSVNAPKELDGDLQLPLSARVGGAYRLGTHWLFVADGLYEPWSGFDNELADNTAFRPGLSQSFSDRLRLSGGVEVQPAGHEQRASYIARISYRLGAYYDKSYVQPNGQSINTIALTAGLSLPTLLTGTHIDLNVEAGTRGTTSDNLVRDRFVGVSASMNFGEEWFQERKLR